MVSTYIWYKVGARNERLGITGVSHWVEHMLFKGTPKFPKDELKRVIEGNGGRWNGFTSTDYTAYYETLPADKVSVALALEADRMQNSIFDPAEVESERTVILSEREGGRKFPPIRSMGRGTGNRIQGTSLPMGHYRVDRGPSINDP